ncbi:MFS transporter [Pseudonocardia acaciae]|uniref:MFS transporter n=1 Tax=Pseudonocardia acaciae TaxID=551276 RepID=UPI0005693262|nr:MFS transporter [Pseudonocardia acaciae]
MTNNVSNRRSWVGVAFALCAVGWGANQFAPMLLWYRAELQLSMATVQATFGLYSLGLVPGLLLGGPLSDRRGRKVVVLPALLVSVLATAVLIAGQYGVGWLFAGRFVAGLASGAAFSAGGAWVKELSSPPYEDAERGAGARRVTAAMSIGFGVGPLVAGVLAQWVPAAGVVPYLPHLVLAFGALPLAWRAPETRDAAASVGGRFAGRQAGQRRGRRHPRLRRVVFPLAPWVFGSAAIGFAYLPGLVGARLHGYAIAFSGFVTLACAFAGVFAQPVARGLDRVGGSRLMGASLLAVLVGVLVASAAAWLGDPVLVLAAAIVLGGAYGLCLVSGLLEVQRLAAPEDLGSATAMFQASAYLGMTVPYLLAAAGALASPPVLLLGVAVLAALSLGWAVRSPSVDPAPEPVRR